MSDAFFATDEEWTRLRVEEALDFVVIGSGFCGLAFVERALENDPHARILVIEQGSFVLPEHVQNLPPPFGAALGPSSERFPWRLSARMGKAAAIRSQCGIIPGFGGRSHVWSGWCPRPTVEDLHGWPEQVVQAAYDYFDDAEALLRVIPATEIAARGPDGGRIYGRLQRRLLETIEDGLASVPGLERVQPAPLAVGPPDAAGPCFAKFATPGALLGLQARQRLLAARGEGAPLPIVVDCSVTGIEREGARATGLQTSRGRLSLGEAELVLAAGALPATALMMRSFPELDRIGTRYSAHVLTTIVARVPRAALVATDVLAEIELAAVYVAGSDARTGGQFHLQLTAIADGDPDVHASIAHRCMPDVVVSADPAQLASSHDHVVLACAVVGELDHRNPDNWAGVVDAGGELELQVVANDFDRAVWDAMDDAAFTLLELVLAPGGEGVVEYWHGGPGDGTWLNRRPPTRERRSPAVMHDGSSMWIGGADDPDAIVGVDYRPRGVDNVYVTGASLWPTAGSWNPTLTMVALTQHLADDLTRPALLAGTGGHSALRRE